MLKLYWLCSRSCPVQCRVEPLRVLHRFLGSFFVISALADALFIDNGYIQIMLAYSHAGNNKQFVEITVVRKQKTWQHHQRNVQRSSTFKMFKQSSNNKDFLNQYRLKSFWWYSRQLVRLNKHARHGFKPQMNRPPYARLTILLWREWISLWKPSPQVVGTGKPWSTTVVVPREEEK